MNKLLAAISNGSPLESLVKNGLEYSQIYELIDLAIDLDYLVYHEDDLVLTDSGVGFISDGPKSEKGGGWILPDDESRIDKIEIDAVFVPRRENAKTLSKIATISLARSLGYMDGESPSWEELAFEP